MEKGLFRKESVDHISSPEQMHDYLRVTSPKLWMILAAIMVLLVGFVAYACTATLESTFELPVMIEYGIITAEVPPAELELIKIRMPVRVADMTGQVRDITQNTQIRLQIAFDDGRGMDESYGDMEIVDKQGLPADLADQSFFLWVNNGEITAYDQRGELSAILKTKNRVTVNGRTATVTDSEVYDTASIMITLDDPTVKLPDGSYHAEIVTESISPISFLLN